MTERDEALRELFPLKYEDGPDYCEVTAANGRKFALTIYPKEMQEMERAILRERGGKESPAELQCFNWAGICSHPEDCKACNPNLGPSGQPPASELTPLFDGKTADQFADELRSKANRPASGERGGRTARIVEELRTIDGLLETKGRIDDCSISVRHWLREAISHLSPPARSVEPCAWTIPGDDTATVDGFIPARIDRRGEFTEPLFASPAPANGVLREALEEIIQVNPAEGRLECPQTKIARAALSEQKP